jgi:hypothetical protein
MKKLLASCIALVLALSLVPPVVVSAETNPEVLFQRSAINTYDLETSLPGDPADYTFIGLDAFNAPGGGLSLDSSPIFMEQVASHVNYVAGMEVFPGGFPKISGQRLADGTGLEVYVDVDYLTGKYFVFDSWTTIPPDAEDGYVLPEPEDLHFHSFGTGGDFYLDEQVPQFLFFTAAMWQYMRRPHDQADDIPFNIPVILYANYREVEDSPAVLTYVLNGGRFDSVSGDDIDPVDVFRGNKIAAIDANDPDDRIAELDDDEFLFTHWSTDPADPVPGPSNNNQRFLPDELVFMIGDVTLYAQYEEIQKADPGPFTLTYHVPPGTVLDEGFVVPPVHSEIIPTEEVTLASALRKRVGEDRFILRYWEDIATGDRFEPGEEVFITKNTNLLAIFSDTPAAPFFIEYDPGLEIDFIYRYIPWDDEDGTHLLFGPYYEGEVVEVMNPGRVIGILSNNDRVVFTHWATTRGGTGAALYFYPGTEDGYITIGGNRNPIRLFARYSPVGPATLTYDADFPDGSFNEDGAVPIDDGPYFVGDFAEVKAPTARLIYDCDFTGERFVFSHWNTEPHDSDTPGRNIFVGTEDDPNVIHLIDPDTTLYARYTELSMVQLRFSANLQPDDTNPRGTLPRNLSRWAGTLVQIPDPEMTVVRDGQVLDFSHWTTDPSNPDNQDAWVFPTEAETFLLIRNTTLHAIYSHANFTVTYSANRDVFNGSVPVDPNAYRMGRSVTVRAPVDLSHMDHGLLNIFDRWFVNRPDGGRDFFVPGDTFVITGNTTLYAAYKEPSFVYIRYLQAIPTDATLVGTWPQDSGPYIEGDNETRIANGSGIAYLRSGLRYDLLGWISVGVPGVEYAFNYEISNLDEDLILNPVFATVGQPISDFEIKYDDNRAFLGFDAEWSVDLSRFTAFAQSGQQIQVINGRAQNLRYIMGTTRYIFSFWTDMPDRNAPGVTRYNSDQIFTITGPITLYAQYEVAEPVTLVYNRNAAGTVFGTLPGPQRSFEGFPVPVQSGVSLIKLEAGIMHLFTSWNTRADGTGDRYNFGDSFYLGAEGATLYAQYVRLGAAPITGTIAIEGDPEIGNTLTAVIDSTVDTSGALYWWYDISSGSNVPIARGQTLELDENHAGMVLIVIAEVIGMSGVLTSEPVTVGGALDILAGPYTFSIGRAPSAARFATYDAGTVYYRNTATVTNTHTLATRYNALMVAMAANGRNIVTFHPSGNGTITAIEVVAGIVDLEAIPEDVLGPIRVIVSGGEAILPGFKTEFTLRDVALMQFLNDAEVPYGDIADVITHADGLVVSLGLGEIADEVTLDGSQLTAAGNVLFDAGVGEASTSLTPKFRVDVLIG